MPDAVAACRVCLAVEVRLLTIAGSLQLVYERITNNTLNTGDGRPVAACFICYAHLNKCRKLIVTSEQAENVLKAILHRQSEITETSISLIDRKALGLCGSLSYYEAVRDNGEVAAPVEVKTEPEFDIVKTDYGNDDFEVVNVHDNGKMEQPLPPGQKVCSKEINKELADVWEELPREDCGTKEITYNSSILSVMSDPSSKEVYSNQLITFPLEAPSRFENSPLIQLEDLEVSHHRSTPVNVELSLQTPMPSSSNIHSIYDSLLFPDHVDNFSVTSTSNSPASQSSDRTVAPRTIRKRQRRSREWADVKRKCLKNLGKKYVTKRGKAVDEKTLGPSCKCRYKCSDKISHQQRLDCFTRFWQLGDKAKQWSFIVKYSNKMKKKSRLNQETPNSRKYSFKYYLPLVTGSSESHEKTEVCQIMFINTLAVSTRILKTAWNKYDGSDIIGEDRRGHHVNHKIVIDDSMKQSVCDHVREFDPVESHYYSNSQELYLPGDLSIARMFRLYLEWFDAEKYKSKATKERQYRDISNSNFNITFHKKGHVFRMKKNPTIQERDFQLHQINKVARNLKNQDKSAEESNGNGTFMRSVSAGPSQPAANIPASGCDSDDEPLSQLQLCATETVTVEEREFREDVASAQKSETSTQRKAERSTNNRKQRESTNWSAQGPYQCDFCKRWFKHPSQMIRHCRTHTGEKPYQCEVCHKAFSIKHDLIRHSRTHTGEKPFQCQVCQRAFTNKSSLLNHNKIHTGEKPFQCEVCHKAFSKKYNLLHHAKIHNR